MCFCTEISMQESLGGINYPESEVELINVLESTVFSDLINFRSVNLYSTAYN